MINKCPCIKAVEKKITIFVSKRERNFTFTCGKKTYNCSLIRIKKKIFLMLNKCSCIKAVEKKITIVGKTRERNFTLTCGKTIYSCRLLVCVAKKLQFPSDEV